MPKSNEETEVRLGADEDFTNDPKDDGFDFTTPDDPTQDSPAARQAPGETDIEVQFVDDTPAADRNVSPIKNVAKDDEIDSINESVQKRINQLKHAAEDARRQTEERDRQLAAAVQYVQHLQSQIQEANKSYTENQIKDLEGRLGKVQERRKAVRELLGKAAEKNMSWGELADLQEELATLVADEREFTRTLEHAKSKPLQTPTPSVQSAYAPEQGVARPSAPPIQIADNVKQWLTKNDWFDTDEVMRAVALGVSDKLFKTGITHATDPDTYFGTIEREVKKRFPEKFKVVKQATRSSPVTPVAQGGKRKVTVQLTASQRQWADKLRVPYEEYARQVMLLEQQNKE